MRWLTLLLFLIACFLINAHSFRVGEEERRIWAPLVLALMTLVTLVRVPLLLRGSWRVFLSPAVLCFVAYLLWLGITQFWSLSPAEGKSHILVLWVALMAALALADERPHQTALLFLGLMTIVMLVSLAGGAVMAPWAKGTESGYRLKGLMAHQQTLALVVSAGMLMALVWSFNRKTAGLPRPTVRLWVFGALGLVTLAATQGRSLSAFFVVAAFMAWFFHMKGYRRFYVLTAAIIVGGGLYVALDVLLPLVSRGNEESLSGRTIVWELTLRAIYDRPWGGYGFGTYADYFKPMWNGWAPGHAHNLWLQAAFEGGIVAAGLLTLFMVLVVKQGLRFQRDTGLVSYALVFTVYFVLGGATSVFFGEKLSALYGLYLLLVVQEERLRLDAVALRRAPIDDAESTGETAPQPA